MSSVSQIPATLDLAIARGDDWSLSLDADIVMTGYVVSAYFVHAVTGAALVTATVTTVDASLGQYTVSLTDAQTAALPLTCKWYLTVTAAGITRAWIGGTVTMTDPQDV